MKRFLPVLSVIGCLISGTAAMAQSTISGTIMSAGISRSYRLYVPAVYTGATPVPLVLNLHGYGSNNVQQEAYGNFRPIADTANFLIVHPNGTVDGNGNRFWNTFGPIGSGINDLAFLSDLIDSLQMSYNIDPDRIYSTGMSNGGFMSHDLACRLSYRIAAIASVTGSMIPSRMNSCSPGRPVPVMQIHGTADNTVPYNGNGSFAPVATLLNKWLLLNNCTPVPTVTAVPDINITDGSTAEHYLYSGGTQGSTVEHYKIIGGGHTWPGSAFTTGVTNRDISASREIWRFFRQYRLSTFLGTAAPAADVPDLEAFPNPVSRTLTISFRQGEQPEDLRVYDVLGREIPLQPVQNAENTITLSTDGWHSGIYYLWAGEQGRQITRKLVKVQE